MAINDITTTVAGNLTADPEQRQSNGTTYTNFRVASTPRFQDRTTGEWKDGTTTFVSVSTTNERLGANIMASLRKGSAVVVDGTISLREFQAKDGSTGHSLDMRAHNVGVSLARAIVQIAPDGRGQQGGGQQGGFNGGQQGGFNGGQAQPQQGGFAGGNQGGFAGGNQGGQAQPQQGGFAGGQAQPQQGGFAGGQAQPQQGGFAGGNQGFSGQGFGDQPPF